MKNFYSIEPKKALKYSTVRTEPVEYNIYTLIYQEATTIVESQIDDSISDEKYLDMVNIEYCEILNKLMTDGIWFSPISNQPLFLYV